MASLTSVTIQTTQLNASSWCANSTRLHQITNAGLAGRSTDDTKRMFLEGIEMVVRGRVPASVSIIESVTSSAMGEVETWRHIGVAPGVQLLLHGDLPKPRPREVKEWLARIEAVLRKNR